MRGIPSTIPETGEVVEIPASEAGRLTLDCPRSRIVRLSNRGRRQLTHYHSVQVGRADVERLAQADVERLARKTEEDPAAVAQTQEQLVPPDDGAAAVYVQEANTKSQTVAPDGQEADNLPTAIASVLLRLFPNGRPAMRVGNLPRSCARRPASSSACSANGRWSAPLRSRGHVPNASARQTLAKRARPNAGTLGNERRLPRRLHLLAARKAKRLFRASSAGVRQVQGGGARNRGGAT